MIRETTVIERQNVATEILRQLGGNRARVMIGMYNAFAVEEAGVPGLSFRFKSRADSGINYIKILLEPSDTYSVQFCKIWGDSIKTINSYTGVYCDQLKHIVESTTGLFLSL